MVTLTFPDNSPLSRKKTIRLQNKFFTASRKGSHIVFTWPFLHFLILQTAVATKRLFQFKSDLEFKCLSHLGPHHSYPNFPRQPLLSRKKTAVFVPKKIFSWHLEKGSLIVFTWPFLHILTLLTAVAAKRLFQFKSDLEFKCLSHLSLHLGRLNFPRQHPTF